MREKNMQNTEKCKNTLKFLDYLRKSQCTMTIDGRNKLGFVWNTPKNDSECEKTLTQMEKMAKDCLESSGFQFKK